jgi:hypothetical protein
MNEHITTQTEAFLTNAANMRVPGEMRAIAQEGVAKSREAFATWKAAALSGTRAANQLRLASRLNAQAVGDSVLRNTQAAAEVAFDAARALARAKTLPEAAQLHVKYAQKQFAIASQQGKELLEASANIAHETTDSLTSIATKAADLAKAQE